MQLEKALAGVAIVIPAGRASLKSISDTGCVSGLMMSNCRTVTLPGPMVSGLKVLLNSGMGTWAWADTATARTATIATRLSVELWFLDLDPLKPFRHPGRLSCISSTGLTRITDRRVDAPARGPSVFRAPGTGFRIE